jgi:hypothetical protein
MHVYICMCACVCVCAQGLKDEHARAFLTHGCDVLLKLCRLKCVCMWTVDTHIHTHTHSFTHPLAEQSKGLQQENLALRQQVAKMTLQVSECVNECASVCEREYMFDCVDVCVCV